MRDAESLLERLLATGAPITLRDTESALGLPPQTRVQALARSLVNRDLTTLFREASALYRDGFAPRSLAERLALELRSALYTQVGLDGDFSLPATEDALLRTIHALDDEMDRFVRHDDLFSLEVALIKASNTLAHNAPRPITADAADTAVYTAAPVMQEPPAPRAADTLPDFNPTGRPAPVRPQPVQTAAQAVAATPQPAAPERPRASWHTVQSRAGTQLKAFMLPARADIEGSDIYVRFAETHKFHFSQLKKRQDELATLVSEVLGEGYTLHLEGPGERVTKKP
jgi:DNA polymerase-3 subunit gamma/tau